MPFPLFSCSILAAMWFQSQGIGPIPRAEKPIELGPIATRNGRALSLPFLRFVPRTEILKSGEESLEASVQVINDVRRDPKDVKEKAVLYEDAETQRVSVRYSKGLASGLEVSVEAPILFRNGGFLDPIINWWHHTLLGGHYRVRDHVPEGLCIIHTPDSGDFGEAAGIGDLSFFVRKRLAPHWVGAVGVKAPTGNAGQLLGSGAPDLGLNFEYSSVATPRFVKPGKLRIDASAGFVAQGKPTVLKHARGLVDQEFLGLTYLRNSRDAFVVQWQSEAAPALTVSSANGAHRMITFGYERRLSDHERMDFYFSEDQDLLPGAPMVVNIAPDFTIGIRFVRKF